MKRLPKFQTVMLAAIPIAVGAAAGVLLAEYLKRQFPKRLA